MCIRDSFGYSVVPQEWNRAICGWWQRRHHFQMQEDWLIFCTGVIPAIDVAVKRMTNAVSYTHLDVYKRQTGDHPLTDWI